MRAHCYCFESSSYVVMVQLAFQVSVCVAATVQAVLSRWLLYLCGGCFAELRCWLYGVCCVCIFLWMPVWILRRVCASFLWCSGVFQLAYVDDYVFCVRTSRGTTRGLAWASSAVMIVFFTIKISCFVPSCRWLPGVCVLF